jgi:hypothetical protein
MNPSSLRPFYSESQIVDIVRYALSLVATLDP